MSKSLSSRPEAEPERREPLSELFRREATGPSARPRASVGMTPNAVMRFTRSIIGTVFKRTHEVNTQTLDATAPLS